MASITFILMIGGRGHPIHFGYLLSVDLDIYHRSHLRHPTEPNATLLPRSPLHICSSLPLAHRFYTPHILIPTAYYALGHTKLQEAVLSLTGVQLLSLPFQSKHPHPPPAF